MTAAQVREIDKLHGRIEALERELDQKSNAISKLADDKAKWIRLFNRLEGAIAHHRRADRFREDHDDALHAAHDRVLAQATAHE